MANLKLAATPGFLPSVGTVSVRFTEPEEATDVKITVFEADRWSIAGEFQQTTGAGGERKRAEILGSIRKRKFTRTNIFTFVTMVALDPIPPSTKTELITPGIMNLTVEHDGTQSFVPLQNIHKEKKLSYFELIFEVSANVGGTPMTYRTPTPVFVRNILSDRAELAFIAGTPDDFDEAYTKLFFTNARKYWRYLKDNLRDELHLKAILDRIRDTPATSRGNAPWGTVNIVSHGSPEAWYMRKTQVEVDKKETGSITATDLPDEDLLGAPPGESVLDKDSLVVLRGCEVGGNLALLNAIRDQFGGRARVYAPLHEMVYRQKNGILQEVLFQKWEFEQPGKKPFPADADLKDRLKTTFGTSLLYGSYTDDQWDAVVAIHETNLNADAFRQFDPRTTDPQEAFDLDRDDVFLVGTNQQRSDLDLFIVTQRDLPTDKDELEAVRRAYASQVGEYEWTWKIRRQPNTNPEKFDIRGEGVKTVYQIFRLLTVTEDGKGPMATPDLDNPRHFGHSS